MKLRERRVCRGSSGSVRRRKTASQSWGGTFPKAAEGPLAVDEGVDEGASVGGLGLVVGVVVVTEGFELGGIFAADEEGLGVDAGFEGVGAGGGFAFGGAGARFEGVETVRGDLSGCGLGWVLSC
jgi:hypothetical protein